jgi:hypothetical protein
MFRQHAAHGGFTRPHQADEIEIVVLAHDGILKESTPRCLSLATSTVE